MSLREYKRKRDFTVTAEPAAQEQRKAIGNSFVVQKHAASRLHYDFRLEIGGTLASWAVPKGFPVTRGERHLAVHVEDHPLDYANFEGTIPQGQYGGGTVMVWDFGTYELIGDEPEKAIKNGKLHFLLTGKKLEGEWTLVRSSREGDDKNWFLIKTGESIRPVSKKQEQHSALSGRTMDQITKDGSAVWESQPRGTKAEKVTRNLAKPDADAKKKPSKARADGASPVKRRPAKSLVSIKREGRQSPPNHSAGLPRVKWIEPMKATLAKSPPEGNDWLYELKWDGFRAIVLKNGEEVELISRNHKALTAEFPEIRDAVARLPVNTALIDGEICALDPHGRPAFQLLQTRGVSAERPTIRLYAFDLLHVDGRDLKSQPLTERKHALQELLKNAPDEIRNSAALEGDVDNLLAHVRELGLEGLIGKQRDSPYLPGVRTSAWLKLKVANEQEFVIGGYTPPQGTRSRFGSLVVGYYKGEKLRFAGKVGTGFDQAALRSLHARMQELRIVECPFADLPRKTRGKWVQAMSPSEVRRCTWVRPELVCQVRFAEWTHDGSLRQPVYLGLREDKAAREVVKET